MRTETDLKRNKQKHNFTRLLLGRDLRTLKNNKKVIRAVYDQESFDELFGLLFHHERPLVMRAADAVEKITRQRKEYLEPHKHQLLSIMKSADHKELKWHVAQLMPRIHLSDAELEEVWHVLTYWALNPNESKIVRVNALQSLFDFAREHTGLKNDFERIVQALEHDPSPSVQARIRKLTNI